MDFVSLGLDISSFSPEKLVILNDFIKTFDLLAKHDGASFNPVMGEGLTVLNKSLQETNAILNEINFKIQSFNANITTTGSSVKAAVVPTEQLASSTQVLVQSQSNAVLSGKALMLSLVAQKEALMALGTLNSQQYQQLAGLNTQIRALAISTRNSEVALRGMGSATGSVSGNIVVAGQKMQSTNTSFQLFGRTATHMLTQLRYLAYILPGIGLAGMFDLAFTAIGKAAEALGVFGDYSSKQLDLSTSENKLLTEQLSLFDQLLKKQNEFHDAFETDYANINKLTVGQEKIKVGQNEAAGIDASTISLQKLNNSKDAYTQSEIVRNAKLTGNKVEDVVGAVKDEARTNFEQLQISANKTKELDKEMNSLARERKWFTNGDVYDLSVDKRIKRNEAAQKEEKQNYELFDQKYKANTNTLKEFYDAKNGLETQDLAHIKLTNDEERKITVGLIKEDESLNIDRQHKIISAAISTEKEKLAAIEKIRKDQLTLNANELYDVTHNNSSTPDQIVLAINKYDSRAKGGGTENVKANMTANEARLKTIEDYNQRILLATTDMKKNELNTIAVENEKISKNEEESQANRLSSYAKFIISKQAENDLDYARERTKQGLVPEELQKLDSDRNSKNIDLQANAQKEIYDIVFSSHKKELEDIIKLNELETNDNKVNHTKALKDLNDRFEKGKIGYKNYLEEVKNINDKFAVSGFDEVIKNDEIELKRLQDHGKDLLDAKQESDRLLTETGLWKEADLGTKLGNDTAIGNAKAIGDAIIETEIKTKQKKEDLDKAEDDRQKARIALILEGEKELFSVKKQIEEESFNLAQTVADGIFQLELEQLAIKQQVVDEGYGSEIAAIEKSSLSAKDKAALDIQLNAEKLASDKTAALEERRIKRDQAIADRGLAVAHVIWSTAEAATNALKIPVVGIGLAAAIEILGALQIATILAAPLPSFAEGVVGFKGGYARTGEAGTEVVKEPYRSPYLVTKDNISYLPPGTDVIPIKDIPDFQERLAVGDGWEQTKWLAKKLTPKDKKVRNIVNIDLGFEFYKHKFYGH